MARKPAVTYDDDAPRLTDAELTEFRPAHEVHSPEELAALTGGRKRGRPVSAAPKVPVTIRLDPETVETFKATGRGWQTRMNEALVAVAAGMRKG